jgi:histidyl-tRNA synthetase
MSTPQKQPRPALKAVRGTRDLLPDQTPLWNRVESTARAVFSRYGFGEIRTPIFESTDLFARGVGEETDIVSKEMFTWEDGERFDRDALRDAWIRQRANPEGFMDELGTSMYLEPASANTDWSNVESIEHKATLVDFVGRLDQGAIEKLRALPIPASFSNVSRTLVVASPNLDKADEQIGDVLVQYLRGNFTKSSQTLTLRPENTAGVVRAYIEHKLGETGHLQKLYYIGPQFRRERPQRGRYRQFWQIGAEVIGPQSSGSESPLRDAEILEMLASLLNELGIRDWRLELNSVGNAEDRARYNAALREALQPVKHLMCEDNQRRADTNPLRVLDSKDEADQAIINALPKIADYLSPESRAHFDQVLAALDACSVPYHLNPRLVRGLDYYTRTTFEFTVTTGLGTQNALLGGGRYDGLSEMLGGPRAPGIGFAIGEDRLILTLQAQIEADHAAQAAAEAEAAKSPETNVGTSKNPGAPHLASEMWGRTKLDAYIAPLGPAQNPAALSLAHDLRSAGLTIEVGDGSFKLRKHFDTADTLARHILLLGEDELATNTVTLKTFATGQQTKVERAALLQTLRPS